MLLTILVPAGMQAGCGKSEPSFVDEILKSPPEARERALEGSRFAIQVPSVLVEEMGKNNQGGPALHLVHPKDEPPRELELVLSMRGKTGVFPEDGTAARDMYVPEGHTETFLDGIPDGWLVVTQDPKVGWTVRSSVNANDLNMLECVSTYRGERADEVVALLKSACGSLRLSHNKKK